MSRVLTPDELLFIVRVQHDTIVSLLDQIAGTQRRITEAYQDGCADGGWTGRMAGAEEAEQDMAEHWGAVVRDARARIGRPTFAERRAAELERAKPRPGDFTGRLSPAEYFGTGDSQQKPQNITALERRAA